MTLFLGKDLIHLEEVDSTNAYLQKLAREKELPEGTVVRAAYQTKGRGQQGTHWISRPGENLLLSMILRPKAMQAEDQFLISQAVALGAREAIAAFIPEEKVQIKWPNDIIASNSKLAGILIENTLQGSSIKYSIAGIGLNVNQQSVAGLPRSGSIHILTGATTDLTAVTDKLLQCIEAWWLRLRAGQAEAVKRTYLEHLFALNESRIFEDLRQNIHFEGKISGIDRQGRLLVAQAENNVSAYNIKEISYFW